MPQGPGEKDLFADLTVKHGREVVELLKAGELDPRFGQQLTAVSEKMGDKMVPPPPKKELFNRDNRDISGEPKDDFARIAWA